MAGGGWRGCGLTGVQSNCVFCSNKHSPPSAARWLSPPCHRNDDCPPLSQGPEVGGKMGAGRPSRRGPPPALGSLTFEAAFYVTDAPCHPGTQECSGKKGRGALRLSPHRGP